MARRQLLAALLSATGLLGAVVPAASVVAADTPAYVVNTQQDLPPTTLTCTGSNPCSLRAAIARGLGTNAAISFGVDGPFRLDGELVITNLVSPDRHTDLAITGRDTAKTVIDGQGKGRVLSITGARVTLSHLTIQGGRSLATEGDPGGGGGMLLQGPADVTLDDAVVTGNQAADSGGGIDLPYASAGAALTIRNSTVARNTAAGNCSAAGGGIHVGTAPVIFRVATPPGATTTPSAPQAASLSPLTIADSVVADNTVSVTAPAQGCSGGAEGGGVSLTGEGVSGSVTRSTISGNHAHGANLATGGGISNSAQPGTAQISNSTIGGNEAAGGQGAWGGGVSAGPGSQVSVKSSTVAGNSASRGSGLFGDEHSTLAFQNTVLANPPRNCDGKVAAAGHDLATDQSCGPRAAGDIVAPDPKLAPLNRYGGLTPTQALLPGSPAIGAGDGPACRQLERQIDQRGKPRFPAGGDRCDIGAYEVQPVAITIKPGCSSSAEGATYSIAVEGSGFTPGAVNLSFGGAPAGNAAVDGESGNFKATIAPARRPPGSYEVQAVGSAQEPAKAVFQEPCPPPPGITLSPVCGPSAGEAQRYSIKVEGTGFAPGEAVISFAGAAAATVKVDESGRFSGTITPAGRPDGSYQVTAADSRGGTAAAEFAVPCPPPPAITVAPTCALTAGGTGTYTIAVEGTGFTPGEAGLSFAGAPMGTAPVDRSGHLKGTITPPVQPAGTYPIRALDSRRGSAEAAFSVPCPGTSPSPTPSTTPTPDPTPTTTPSSSPSPLTSPTASPSPTPPASSTPPCGAPGAPACSRPTLVITPTVGPAGFTTGVRGSGFPARTAVSLRWDRGVTQAALAKVTTDGSGSFEVSALILPHDSLGLRKLRATPTPGGARFDAVEAGYLVVPGSGQPPEIPNGAGPGGESLVIRR